MRRVAAGDGWAVEVRGADDVAKDPREERAYRIRVRTGRGKRWRAVWLSDADVQALIAALSEAL